MDNTIFELLNSAVKRYLDCDAIRFFCKDCIKTKTYQEFFDDIVNFSNEIENKIEKGEHIALIGASSYRMLVAFFGITISNRVAVFIDNMLPMSDICKMLQYADVHYLVFENNSVINGIKNEYKGIIGEIFVSDSEDNQIINISENDENQGKINSERIVNPSLRFCLDADALAAIFFTSGTTDTPKGVMLSQGNLARNVTCRDYGAPPNITMMCSLPMHHIYSLFMNSLFPLYLGMTICINDSMTKYIQNIHIFKPDFIAVVPTMLKSLSKLLQNYSNLSYDEARRKVLGENIKYICCGGAYLDTTIVDLFEKYGIFVYQGYGMTESTGIVSTNTYNITKNDSVGTIQPICQVRIVEGEIQVSGSNVMLGYYKEPNKTAEAFDGGWLKTGDLGYLDDEGFLHITGRLKNLIITSNGENVSPEELEAGLLQNPLIKDVVVLQREDHIEADVFPDIEYVRKYGIVDLENIIKACVDELNRRQPTYKRIARINISDKELVRSLSGRVKHLE